MSFVKKTEIKATNSKFLAHIYQSFDNNTTKKAHTPDYDRDESVA